MMRQWVATFTTKQIVTFLLMIAVFIYVVWYVVGSLGGGGFDPDYRPSW